MSQTAGNVCTSFFNEAKRPRLAFVGVGWIGFNRMKALADSGNAEIRAIVEPQEGLARRAQQLAPDAEILGDFTEAIESDVDGIVIATPSAFHAEQATLALREGLAVFCQKPLGRNHTETQRAIDAARASDRLLKVDLCYRFVAAAARIRELIQHGSLGDVFALDLAFHNAYGPDKAWFYDPNLSGGGCLIDLGIHLVDLALWLLDFPAVENVSGTLFTNGRKFVRGNAEVEDFATATIRLAPHVDVNVACSWRAHAGQDAVIEAAVYGTKGGARLRNVNGSFYDFAAEQYTGTSRQVLIESPDCWGGRAALDWLARLTRGNRFDPDIENLGIVASVLDRIYG